MLKAILLLVASLVVIEPTITPAYADFDSDKRTCVKPGMDFDEEIRACDRQLASGRYSGVNRAIVYRNRGIKLMNRWANTAQPADIASALADFTRALEMNPRYADAYVSRGKAHGAKGDSDLALADLNEAIRIDPKSAEAYVSRGIVLRNRNELDRAIADYNEALRVDPRNTMALNNRGITWRAKKDDDRAIADYSEAIRVDPRYAFAYNNRALIYRAKGDSDRALADLSEAVRIDSNYGQAFQNRGDLYRSKGEFDRAIADFSDAIRASPRSATAYIDRGNAYREKGEHDRAIADFSEAIRIDPKNGPAFRNRGFAYSQKGDPGRALVEYNEALRLDANDVVAYNNRGTIFLGRNLIERAIGEFDESIRRDPQFPLAFTNRGLAWEKAGDIAAARADYTKALSLPEKLGSGKWPYEKARERLTALEGVSASTAKPAMPPPAPAPKPADIAIPSISAPAVVAAPPPPPKPAVATAALTPAPITTGDRRIALVIGNSAYTTVSALTNPRRDAALVAETLKKTGFSTVTVLTDLRKDALMTALREFAAQAEAADWAVVYYAGHGMEVGGVNYLIPVDARIAVDRDIEFEAVPLGQILNAAERARKLRLVILDACRNNPFANKMKRTLEVASRSTTQGLAAVEPEAGTMVVYAAKDGEVALDGAGANSPFATALVKNLPTPGLEVRRLFDYVRDDVMDLTKRKQKPFSYGSISGRQDFYFVAAKQ